MRIKKTYVDFVKDFDIGRRAYHVELDEHGYEIKIEEQVRVSSDYGLIVIKGDPELKQQSSILSYLKGVKKVNPGVCVRIYVSGLVKPCYVNLSVDYVVLLSSGDVDEKVVGWLVKSEAKFVLRVGDDDDLEYVNTLVSALLIPKSLIYLDVHGLRGVLVDKVRVLGYNLFVEVDGDW